MKKFAWMIAALSLCACTFTACGDDDKDNNTNANKAAIGADCKANADCESGLCKDSKCAAKDSSSADKKANDEACEKADDCQSGYCSDDKKCADKPAGGDDKKANDEACENADDCQSGYCSDDKKCADKPASGDKCTNDDECTKGGKLYCHVDSGACVECLADNALDDACDNSKPGPVCISNACAKCTEDKQCGDKRVCDKDSGKCSAADGTCWEDKDCKDSSKPVCGSDHICVASTAECGLNTPCADSSKVCAAGKCVAKAAKNDACDDSFVARCSNDMKTLISCKDKKVIETKCSDYAASSKEQYLCMFSPDGIADCALECASKDANLKEGDIEFPNCTEDKGEAWNYTCLNDFYKSGLFSFAVIEKCASGKKCDASGAKAVCK